MGRQWNQSDGSRSSPRVILWDCRTTGNFTLQDSPLSCVQMEAFMKYGNETAVYGLQRDWISMRRAFDWTATRVSMGPCMGVSMVKTFLDSSSRQ